MAIHKETLDRWWAQNHSEAEIVEHFAAKYPDAKLRWITSLDIEAGAPLWVCGDGDDSVQVELTGNVGLIHRKVSPTCSQRTRSRHRASEKVRRAKLRAGRRWNWIDGLELI